MTAVKKDDISKVTKWTNKGLDPNFIDLESGGGEYKDCQVTTFDRRRLEENIEFRKSLSTLSDDHSDIPERSNNKNNNNNIKCYGTER